MVKKAKPKKKVAYLDTEWQVPQYTLSDENGETIMPENKYSKHGPYLFASREQAKNQAKRMGLKVIDGPHPRYDWLSR